MGAWANAALKDFVSRMPEGVRFAAVVHLDEAHVHFHILAVNMADLKMSANKLHVGKIAAEKWRHENGSSTTLEALPRPKLTIRPNKPRKPKPSKNRATQAKRDAVHAAAVSAWEADCAEVEIANATAVAEWEVENAVHLQAGRKARKAKVEDVDAYRSAMVAFQDRYFEAVGKPCGLLRNGPGTERLSTKQYAARKTRAREMADQDAAQRAVAERNAQEAKRLQDGMERLNADRQALEHGMSEGTFYNWKAKFGGMTVPEAKRLKTLEDENAKLKKLLAEGSIMGQVRHGSATIPLTGR